MSDHFNILEQLNEKTLGSGSDATSIQTVTDNIHLTNGNKDLLKVVELINRATMRDGNPIPGTGQVSKTLITDGDTGHYTIFQPPKGEIWEVCSISVKPTATGTINLSVSLEDSTSGERCVVDTGTGNVTATTVIDIVNGPLFISNECFLQSYIGTNSGGATFNIACYRIR